MLLNVFAKKRMGKDGKVFYNFLSTLTKKNGEQETVQLKFREDAGIPNASKCPMTIEVEKSKANLTKKMVTVEKNGEEKEIEQRTLWISEYEYKGDYVDTSLDEYED